MQVLARLFGFAGTFAGLFFFVGVITTRPIAAVYVKGVEAVHAPIADDAEEGLTKAGHSYPPATGNVAPRRSAATAGDWTLRKGDASNRTARSPRTVSAVGHLPPSTPMIVNYKDDEPSRMRAAGLLKGALPLPLEGSIAAGGCTFDIECDDANPCTRDVCEIDVSQGMGSGKCSHAAVSPGEPGDCDDGVFCNGREFCNSGGVCQSGLAATCCTGGPGNDPPQQYCSENAGLCADDAPLPGKLCAADADCGGKECNHCRAICSTNADCGDGYVCNGVETCAGGQCVAGVPPCGGGALCSEKKCSGTPTTACVDDADCPSGQTCTGAGPVCYFGRCCDPINPATCSTLKLANCTGGKHWYAGDAGRENGAANTCGGVSPINPGVQLGCPRYTSGISQLGLTLPSHPVTVGPVSASVVAVSPPNGPGAALNRLGDDYQFDPFDPSTHMMLVAVRFVGYVSVPDAIFVEFWDENGNFIEELQVRPSLAAAVNLVYLEEPLVIPPRGYMTAVTKRETGPDVRFFWLSATTVNEGANDPSKLFVNNDPNAANFMGLSPGILSFELVGSIVIPPLGGCCDPMTGACGNELEWVCRGDGRTFQGVGSYCNTCLFGSNTGAPCSRCSGGGTPGASCNADADCSGGTCTADNAVCNVGSSTCSNDASNTCTSSAECVARSNVCSNRDQGCVFSSDCPPGGVCGGAGTCEAGLCATLDACGVGACCNSTTGACTPDTALGGCTGGGETFLGLGTDCDPNCCPQPAGGWTGADDCQNAVIHWIPTLNPYDPPYVITITGDDSYASSTLANPDSCFGPPTSVASDLGWWQSFFLTGSCTRVRIDHCGSSPTQRGSWSWLARDCSCNEMVNATPDPYITGVGATGYGSPYCDDANVWMQFGLLGPGEYFYSTLNSLQVGGGPYQMHIVAEGCPTAACCRPDGSCIDDVNQHECDALGGIFLAPPQQSPAIALCVGSPGACATGSCCTGPGQCQDEVFGAAIDMPTCEGLGGRYLGGIRCQGGYCQNDPRFSCGSDADCASPGPGGMCVGLAQSEAQPNPCPACEITGVGNCQTWDDHGSLTPSDVRMGAIVADDLIAGPGTGQISQVCVWGAYLVSDADRSSMIDCWQAAPSDNFSVRILADTGFHFPDRNVVVGQSAVMVQRAIEETASSRTADPPYETFGYQLTLITPITGLVPGTVYWLEVTNDLPASIDCNWNWSSLRPGSSAGNQYSVLGTADFGYPPCGGASPQDFAWCVGGAIEVPAPPVRSVCDCMGNCQYQTAAEAIVNRHEWCANAVDDGGGPLICGLNYFCPSDPSPSNDECSAAAPIPVGLTTFNNACAATDGLPTIKTDDRGNRTPIVDDVWYKFAPRQNCFLNISMCGMGSPNASGFDPVMAVYSDGTSRCPCPLDDANAASTWVGGNDNGCMGTMLGGPSSVSGIPVSAGECVTIRVGGSPGLGYERGAGLLNVTCGGPVCGDNLAQPGIGEECDGVDDAACPGGCNPPGDPNACKCSTPVCPNGNREGAEECDGVDAAACPGLCQFDCTCSAICGNGQKEPDEECDSSDATACPGRCQGDCICPPRICGNDFVEFPEECDGTDNESCGGYFCRPPGNAAGECTCTCGALPIDALPLLPEPNPTEKNRYISFVVDPFGAGQQTALRVRLTSLHHPIDPPPGTPNFTAFEGQYRYVNVVGTGTCPDSPVFATTFKCGTLSCTPQYRDWAAELAGAVLHVTGADIVPSSIYDVAILPVSCAGVELACAGASTELPVRTSLWGDITAYFDGSRWLAPDGFYPNFDDIMAVVQKFKDTASAPIKPRVQMYPNVPNPMNDVSAIDIAMIVDAFKGRPYALPGPQTCALATIGNAPSPGEAIAVELLARIGRVPSLSDAPATIVSAAVAGVPNISFVPVKATGLYAVNGSEILLEQGGVNVFLEIRLSGWDPNGDAVPTLSYFQATVDPMSYLGFNAQTTEPFVDLSAASVPCATTAECTAAYGQPGASCGAGKCAPAFQDVTRTDWVFAEFQSNDVIAAIRTARPEFAWGAAVGSSGEGALDRGASLYGGTLVLNVPAAADGTYTINLINNLALTFLVGNDLLRVPGLTLTPAKITVNRLPKGRYLPVRTMNAGPTALRVSMLELFRPVPPHLGAPPGRPLPDFSAFEHGICTAAGEQNSCYRWVGPPELVCEYGGRPPCIAPGEEMWIARLQCEPYFGEWWHMPDPIFLTVHVTGAEVLPSSLYRIDQCTGVLGCEDVIYSFEVRTSRWGDVAPPFQDRARDPSTQPTIADVTELVDKVKQLPGKAPRVRAQLQPSVPGIVSGVNVLDIANGVDALKGFPYPFSGPCICPSEMTCEVPGDCASSTDCTGGRSCVNGKCGDLCGQCRP
ncbi:MAG: hypothetical protein AABZ12_07060 [Planctomycetota bacterium]